MWKEDGLNIFDDVTRKRKGENFENCGVPKRRYSGIFDYINDESEGESYDRYGGDDDDDNDDYTFCLQRESVNDGDTDKMKMMMYECG